MEYFISDLHFGSNNILKSRSMFNCTKEMDQYLIERWNNKVMHDDTVYIIGDLGGSYSCDLESIIKELRGNKILILGNHDTQWLNMAHISYDKYFVEIREYTEIDIGSYHLVLCHYPLLEWPGSRKSQTETYMLHGHIHDRIGNTYAIIKEHLPKLLNCCPEINNYQPSSVAELIINNTKWYERKNDYEEGSKLRNMVL